MRISVYNIYVLALIVAAVAATLSGVQLSAAFTSQQAESELAQRNLGEGQMRATMMMVTHQMDRIESSTEANTRQLAMWAAQLPPSALAPAGLLQAWNRTLYEAWAPRIRSDGSMSGFGVALMYLDAAGNVTDARAFGMWKDILRTGENQYAYAYPSVVNTNVDVYENVWLDFATPCLTRYLYSYNPLAMNMDSYLRDDYLASAVPWSASDGNAYWSFTYQRSLLLPGVRMVVTTWDVGVLWRDRMREIRGQGAEVVILDNNDMVMAATTEAEAVRLRDCGAKYPNGVVQAACLQIPAAQHPVAEIRELRNALYTPQWYDVTADAIPMSHYRVMIRGQPYKVVVATLYSSGSFRATGLWYQPWTQPPTNVAGLITIIVILTVLATGVVALLGIFGILRPLIRLGRSMRSVADNLKYGDGGGAKALVQRRSMFTEVYSVQMDFETIAMDFLGFSSTRKAAEQADTVLNHILKNTMADAAACIQLYADGRAAQVAPDLAQAVTCLARGMQWCRKRHVLMRMAQGDYLPALHPVSLREFGERLVRGRPVLSSFPNEVALLDEVLCDILLDNALNNAFRHCNPVDPHVQFCMELAPLDEPAASAHGSISSAVGGPHRQLTFRISNRADPAKPRVTPDLVEFLLEQRTEQRPVGDRSHVYSSALSEHLGLHHMFKVAETHGMALTLQEEGEMVVLRAQLKVQLAREPSLSERADLSVAADDVVLPVGLRIWALDDSPIARRLLMHSLPKHFPGASVHVYGDAPEQVSKFVAHAATDADIIILDQHLDYSTESFLGTSVLADLLELRCRAFICIRSASVAHSNEAAFRAAGAHCALGKDLRPEDFFNTLKRLYRGFLLHPPSAVMASMPPQSPRDADPMIFAPPPT